VKHLVALASRWRPPQVVIVADADLPGQRGAESLAAVLRAYVTRLRLITPPAKDAREWKRQGADYADVQALIEAAPLRKLSIQVQRSRHGR
jgi:hypothetical protein